MKKRVDKIIYSPRPINIMKFQYEKNNMWLSQAESFLNLPVWVVRSLFVEAGEFDEIRPLWDLHLAGLLEEV